MLFMIWQVSADSVWSDRIFSSRGKLGQSNTCCLSSCLKLVVSFLSSNLSMSDHIDYILNLQKDDRSLQAVCFLQIKFSNSSHYDKP